MKFEIMKIIIAQANFDPINLFSITLQLYFPRLINDWVKDSTKEKIKDLFQPSSFNQNTSIVLVNAIYFKGDWTNKFDPKLTKKSDFYLQPDQTIKVIVLFVRLKIQIRF